MPDCPEWLLTEIFGLASGKPHLSNGQLAARCMGPVRAYSMPAVTCQAC